MNQQPHDKQQPDSSTTPFIQFTGVDKFFGDIRVLEGFDLTFQRNERAALIGPSGSGKSTILRLLMTLEQPTAGRIQIEGEDLWPDCDPNRMSRPQRLVQDRLRLRIGMVFQHFNLFPHLKVLDNVALAPQLVLGDDQKDARERALELLDSVGLKDKGNNYPAELSGGQQQRVAIARALAMKPDIMLFDEATSGLDPELVGEVVGVIQDLAERGDMTMLFVTHQLHLVEHIAHRVLMLDGGQIVEDRVPRELLDSPHHDRTKAFLAALEFS